MKVSYFFYWGLTVSSFFFGCSDNSTELICKKDISTTNKKNSLTTKALDCYFNRECLPPISLTPGTDEITVSWEKFPRTCSSFVLTCTGLPQAAAYNRTVDSAGSFSVTAVLESYTFKCTIQCKDCPDCSKTVTYTKTPAGVPGYYNEDIGCGKRYQGYQTFKHSIDRVILISHHSQENIGDTPGMRINLQTIARVGETTSNYSPFSFNLLSTCILSTGLRLDNPDIRNYELRLASMDATDIKYHYLYINLGDITDTDFVPLKERYHGEDRPTIY